MDEGSKKRVKLETVVIINAVVIFAIVGFLAGYRVLGEAAQDFMRQWTYNVFRFLLLF